MKISCYSLTYLDSNIYLSLIGFYGEDRNKSISNILMAIADLCYGILFYNKLISPLKIFRTDKFRIPGNMHLKYQSKIQLFIFIT